MAQGSKRRGRILIILAIVLILGLVLVWILARGVLGALTAGGPSAAEGTQSAPSEMVDIVVVAQPVTKGTILSEAVLTTIPYPREQVVEGTFYTDMTEVVGKSAAMNLTPPMPLTSSLIIDTSVGSFPAFEVPRGMVAISIPVDSLTSVSYAPQAGDHVNVIVSLLMVDLDTNFQTLLPNQASSVVAPGSPPDDAPLVTGQVLGAGSVPEAGRTELDPNLGVPVYVEPSEPQRPRLVAQTLLQDAVVLQSGLFDINAPDATPGQDGAAVEPGAEVEGIQVEQIATPQYPQQMTLIVAPQDAVTLSYLVNAGAKLTLALRGAGDDQRIQTEAVTLQYLMDQYAIPLPVKLPYGLEPRLNEIPAPEEFVPAEQPAE